MKEKGFFGKVMEMTNLSLDSKISDLKKSTDKLFGVNKTVMRRSWEVDQERMNSEYGFINKPSLLSDVHKTLMYIRNPIIASIVQTRTTQAGTFAVPQKDKYVQGYVFERRDGEEVTDEDQIEINGLKKFIDNCGLVDQERTDADEDMTFETFIKLIVKDTYIYDPIAIEIVPDHQGNAHHFLPVSAATILLAAPNLSASAVNEHWNHVQDFNQELADKGKYKYVQRINGQIRRAFTKDRLIFEFRNPVNDIFTQGYPIGELDLLINVVTAHTNADTFNRSLFTNGFVSQGIINLKGDVDDEQLKALRRSWHAQGVGPNAMFKTPIINAPEGIEFIKLDVSHKEMEYSNYINYLVKLICAVYQIAPDEIGFAASGKSEGGGGNSQNYNNVEKKLKMSRDRGLRPLLRFLESVIDDKIIARFNKRLHEKYVFKFVGLNSEDRMEEINRHKEEVKVSKTVNEIRKEKGLPVIPGADFLLDQTFYNWYSSMSPTGVEFNDAQTQKQLDLAKQQGGEGGEGESAPPIQYVDENGNPVDPKDIDPTKHDFVDEDGRAVGYDGNEIQGAPASGMEDDEEKPDVEWTTKLPFEDDDFPF